MDKQNPLNLKAFVSSAINEVFDTMLSIEVEGFDADEQLSVEESQLRGLVKFDGDLTGSFSLQVSEVFARVMTASMLGMDVEEIEGEDEVKDVINEVLSIISGSLKTAFTNCGMSCEFFAPLVATGDNIKIEAEKCDIYKRFDFRHQENHIFIEVGIQTGKASQIAEELEGKLERGVAGETPSVGDNFQISDETDVQEAIDTEDEVEHVIDETKAEEAIGSEDHFQVSDETDVQEAIDTDDEVKPFVDETEAETDEKTQTKLYTEEKKKRKISLKEIAILVLVFACFIGLLNYLKPAKKSEIHQKFSSTQKIEKPKPQSISLIDDGLGKIADLRKELIVKQKDIVNLKKYYQKGIVEVENELLSELYKKRLFSFKEALKDKRIELGLRTIQRRQAYIQQLDQPYHKLHLSSEELLYLKRKITIDIQMVDICDSITIDNLAKQITIAIDKQRLVNDKLAIDKQSLRFQSLETIWQKIYADSKKYDTIKELISEEDKRNYEIWQEICDGNFDRKHDLSKLSLKATIFLSQWEGKDLSLNRLIKLSEEVAKHLSRWKGEWLSLNGLAELSPEVAKHLSQWGGERLSLNGLRHLPPEAAKYLSQWKGQQLELIGIKDIIPGGESKAFLYLEEWERSGGKLFISSRVMQPME